jgi:hypothetical protein
LYDLQDFFPREKYFFKESFLEEYGRLTLRIANIDYQIHFQNSMKGQKYNTFFNIFFAAFKFKIIFATAL